MTRGNSHLWDPKMPADRNGVIIEVQNAMPHHRALQAPCKSRLQRMPWKMVISQFCHGKWPIDSSCFPYENDWKWWCSTAMLDSQRVIMTKIQHIFRWSTSQTYGWGSLSNIDLSLRMLITVLDMSSPSQSWDPAQLGLSQWLLTIWLLILSHP